LQPSIRHRFAISVGLAPDDERLLLVNIAIVNAEGRLILQTAWAPVADRFGRRRTSIETCADQATLTKRLTELVPALFPKGFD
jgi:hypothetical protein